MKVWPKGTIINMLTVTLGSLIGLWFRQFFSENIQEIVFQALGLSILLIGIIMALRLPDGYYLACIFSLIIGAIIGQLLRIDIIINEWSDSIKLMAGISESNFSEGLITAFLLFCLGSMSIVGALEEGLNRKKEVLYVKSILDGFSAIALAATYGIGVLFSIFPLFILQGGITWWASRFSFIFSQVVLDALSAVGGILMVGIAFKLMKFGNIWLENLLPSLVIIVVAAFYYEKYQKQHKLEV